MPAIAFFDVDGTLMQGYSGYYTTLLLIQKKIMKKRRLLQALFYKTISKIVTADIKKIYTIACMDLAGMTLDQVLKIGEESFLKDVKKRLYIEALEKVKEHQRRGDKVYLVTSAPYMTIEHLADFLKVDGHYSAGPIIDYKKNPKGVLLKEVKTPIYFREGKIQAALDATAKHGVDLKDCYYYADSIDDTFLFEKVGHPFMVNPDSKLSKIGKQKNWPELHFTKMMGES